MKTNYLYKPLLAALTLLLGSAATATAQDWSINFQNLVSSDQTLTISDPVISVDGVGLGTASWGELATTQHDMALYKNVNSGWDSWTESAQTFIDGGLEEGCCIQFAVYLYDENNWGLDLQLGWGGLFSFVDGSWKGETTGDNANKEIRNTFTDAYTQNVRWAYIDIWLTPDDISKLKQQGMSLGCWGISIVTFTIFTFEQAYKLDPKLVLQTSSTWMLRPSSKYNGGLYSMNSGNRSFGLLNCQKGDEITIVTQVGQNNCPGPDPNVIANATLKSKNETGSWDTNTYVYKVNANGAVRFNPGRYIMIRSISITHSDDPVEEQEYVEAPIGTSGYATFSSTEPLNFTEVEGLKAYVATSYTDDAVILEQVTGDIAAYVGLVIVGSTQQIPVAGTNGTWPQGNLLVAVSSTQTVSGSGNYVLTNEITGVPHFAVTTNQSATVTAGHAYLSLGNNARNRSLGINTGGTTGISSVKASPAQAGGIYTLSGQRVTTPEKGIYIIGGKKVIIK